MPRSLKDLAAVSREAEEEFELREGRIPTAQELAENLGVEVERLLEARLAAAAQYPDSLDRPLSAGEDDSASVQERVGIADRDLTEMEDGASLEMLTSGLGARDRELLRLRFEEDLTQAAIGERIGVSQMQVSRVLRHAVGRLRTLARVETGTMASD